MKLKNFTLPGIASWRAINHARQERRLAYLFLRVCVLISRPLCCHRSAIERRGHRKRGAVIKRTEAAERGDVARAHGRQASPGGEALK